MVKDVIQRDKQEAMERKNDKKSWEWKKKPITTATQMTTEYLV